MEGVQPWADEVIGRVPRPHQPPVRMARTLEQVVAQFVCDDASDGLANQLLTKSLRTLRERPAPDIGLRQEVNDARGGYE